MSNKRTSERVVQKIEARKVLEETMGIVPKRRVAGYARVSTDSEEQINSYEAQVDYYTKFITGRADWIFIEVYTDEGITALNTRNRHGFNRMIADAVDGKMDLIITKSIARFARNTVDTLNTVRLLKEKGVEVYFEKENIYTFDSKGEVLITIFSSLAQEESRTISENVAWGWRKKFSDGQFSLPYKQFLGYEKGPDDLPRIVESEAAVVRNIYALYLQGKSISTITKQLTNDGVPTPSGKPKWHGSVVQSILRNEKYAGAALLQKTFTLDFLEKKRKWNDGEVDQYYHTGTHEAIIEPWVFDQAQLEMERRQALGRSFSGGVFGGRVVCGECGGLYGPKVWYSGTKYQRTIWRCNHKYEKGKSPCPTPHFTEDEIKRAFVTVFNRMLPGKENIIVACRETIAMLLDTSRMDASRAKLTAQLDAVSDQIRKHISLNASEAQNQDAYGAEYEKLAAKYTTLKQRLAQLDDGLRQRHRRCIELNAYMDALADTGELLTEFDARLWAANIDVVTVRSDRTMAFRFKDGREMAWI